MNPKHLAALALLAGHHAGWPPAGHRGADVPRPGQAEALRAPQAPRASTPPRPGRCRGACGVGGQYGGAGLHPPQRR